MHADVSKKHVKGTKLRASTKNKEHGEGVRFLFSPPLLSSRSPLPTSPQAFAHPRHTPSLACLEKERKRLLHSPAY